MGVFDKTKKILDISSRWPAKSVPDLAPEDVKAARAYIAKYWRKLIRYHPQDNDNLIGLPRPYLVPSYEKGHEFDYDELYYWDSYFMVQGLLDAEHKQLVSGILDDLLYLFRRFKIIPNASRTYLTSRSQPPFLTSFILDVHETYQLSEAWLVKAMEVAFEEYQTVWMGTRKPNARQVYRGLSRYYDFNYLPEIAEAESGWDMTPRFDHKALDWLPVDLNTLLYKYEMDFGRAAELVGKKTTAAKWIKVAKHRRRVINELMWDQGKGFYYDYNYVKQKPGTVASLAGFYPLWAGMASTEQATRLVKNLRHFEQKGGLATTDSPTLSQRVPVGQIVPGMLNTLPTQWAYPNGWAPLHFLIVQGLIRYHYHDDAHRIAMKWLRTNLGWFNEHGVFLEKYNVVQPNKPPQKGLYPSQTGFGWTNAVFERFCREFIDANTPR